MIKYMKKLYLFGLSVGYLLLLPLPTQAASSYLSDEVKVEMTSGYVVRIDEASVDVHKIANSGANVVGEAKAGQLYEVLDYKNDWIKISTESGQGYLKMSDEVTLIETTTKTVDSGVVLRENVVNYALQYLGNAYAYGGVDPNRGVDCSGFTAYIMRNAANVSLPHSSSGQARYGQEVVFQAMKPGDLLFYSNSASINHVAMYIGNGQVVHASTEKSGIKISPWNYRTPVKAMDILSKN